MIDRSIPECVAITHPAVYRIRVSGRIDPKWSECLQGMAVTVFEKQGQVPFTELSGLLPDQAALMGVLEYLYNCNIPLLGMECVSAEAGSRSHPQPPAEEDGGSHHDL
jgi:hypothetical protein